MTKRAHRKFPRRKQDAYDTPQDAVERFVGHLPPIFRYAEPCAGSGALVAALRRLRPEATCVYATDLEPRHPKIRQADGHDLPALELDYVITNPPWPASARSQGEPTRGLVHRWTEVAPTWILLGLDTAANIYLSAFPPCRKIVPIGRVSWMGNGGVGYDNAAWFLFDRAHLGEPVLFRRRAKTDAA